MKRLVTCALAALLGSTAASALEGTWTATTEVRGKRIHLELRHGRTGNLGTTHAPSALPGLTAERVRSHEATPVAFTLDRDAGKVEFEGTFRNGRGEGRFTFRPAAGYLDAVRDLGIDVSSSSDDSREDRLLVLAVLDVSTDYIRGLIADGYRVSLDEYRTMRIFDVTPTYIRTMRDLGFAGMSADDLVAARIHDVTPEFVRAMRESGRNLSIDELLSFRIHGVTLEWIAELGQLGYDHLDSDELVSTRIFQVTPAFIRSVEAAGFRDLPMRELISMRVRGIDADDLARRRVY